MCHSEYISEGCHRDAIKIKVDLDMNMPSSSAATQSKAPVAIICKIVPTSTDVSTLQDYDFVGNCQRNEVEKANLPKPL